MTSRFRPVHTLPPFGRRLCRRGRIASLGGLGRVTEVDESAEATYATTDAFPAAASHRAESGYIRAFYSALNADLVTVTDTVDGAAVYSA